MEAKDCTLKTRVALVGRVAPLLKGKIAGEVSQHPTLGETVIVEWDDGRVQKVTTRSLLTEAVGLQEDARLQAEVDALQAAFEKVSGEIREKMKKAAVLVNEAAKLAKAHNVDIQDTGVADDLEYAMEKAGWRTSSWHC